MAETVIPALSHLLLASGRPAVRHSRAQGSADQSASRRAGTGDCLHQSAEKTGNLEVERHCPRDTWCFRIPEEVEELMYQ